MMIARRTFLTSLGLLAAAVAVAPSAEAAPPSAEQVVDNVQKFYDKTKTFTAGFKQKFWIKRYNKIKESHGAVVFGKPGKMSWRYKNNGNRVVSDGKEIKVYERDNKQMFIAPMQKSEHAAALSFLIGGGKLKKEFRVRLLDAKKLKFEGGFVIEARPKKATPAYKTMLMYIDAATYQVRRVLLLDAQGNRNRFDFVAPVANKRVPPDEFKFKPPPGTRVVKQ